VPPPAAAPPVMAPPATMAHMAAMAESVAAVTEEDASAYGVNAALDPVSARAGPGASPPQGGQLAKDKGWADMTAVEQAAAKLLGYDDTSWDEGEVPPTCEMPWDELAQRSQRAALLLGYTRDEWETERLAGDEEDA